MFVLVIYQPMAVDSILFQRPKDREWWWDQDILNRRANCEISHHHRDRDQRGESAWKRVHALSGAIGVNLNLNLKRSWFWRIGDNAYSCACKLQRKRDALKRLKAFSKRREPLVQPCFKRYVKTKKKLRSEKEAKQVGFHPCLSLLFITWAGLGWADWDTPRRSPVGTAMLSVTRHVSLFHF